jgi:spermidine/putrescine transport system substrate-binding protein
VQVQEENEDIRFFVPEEGAPFSCDDLVIPKAAKHPELALAFIEFLCDPARAARNMEYIGYLSPNKDAWALVDEETRANTAIFVDPEIRAKCQPFDDLGDDLRVWSEAWDTVKAG